MNNVLPDLQEAFFLTWKVDYPMFYDRLSFATMAWFHTHSIILFWIPILIPPCTSYRVWSRSVHLKEVRAEVGGGGCDRKTISNRENETVG